MKGKIFFPLILWCLAFYAEAQKSTAYETTIQHIEIQTAHIVLKESIQDRVSKYKNRVFSQKLSEQIQNEILQSLQEKKILLPQVAPPRFSFEKGKVSIVYAIKNPYRYGFILKGNKEFNRYTLSLKKQYIKYFNNNQLIRKLVLYIKTAYLKKGYKNVQVSYNIQIDSKHFIKSVFISIDEGVKTKIHDIKIFGQFSQPEKYYVKFLRKHSGLLIKKNFFYEEDIKKGLQNLVHALKNKGYFKARAQSRVIDVSNSKVVVEITLNEGPVALVKEISFKGNRYFSNEKLLQFMQIKKEQALNLVFLEEDIKNIIDKYQSVGFINIQIKPATKYGSI